MHRVFVPVATLVLLFCVAPPSQAWWGYRHFHHVQPMYHAQPAVAPFSVDVGALLTGNWQQIIADSLGQLRHRQGGSPDAFALDPAISTKVDSIQAEVNAGVADLNALTDRINANKLSKSFRPKSVEAGFTKLPTLETTPAGGDQGGPGGQGGKKGPPPAKK